MTVSLLRVAWARSAARDLARIPEQVAVAVVDLVYTALAAEPAVDGEASAARTPSAAPKPSAARKPNAAGKPLARQLAGLWAVRRDNYRVIYLIGHDQRATVVAVQLHSGGR